MNYLKMHFLRKLLKITRLHKMCIQYLFRQCCKRQVTFSKHICPIWTEHAPREPSNTGPPSDGGRPTCSTEGDTHGGLRRTSALLTNYSLIEIQTAFISGYLSLAICYLAFENLDNVPLKLKWAADSCSHLRKSLINSQKVEHLKNVETQIQTFLLKMFIRVSKLMQATHIPSIMLSLT